MNAVEGEFKRRLPARRNSPHCRRQELCHQTKQVSYDLVRGAGGQLTGRAVGIGQIDALKLHPNLGFARNRNSIATQDVRTGNEATESTKSAICFRAKKASIAMTKAAIVVAVR